MTPEAAIKCIDELFIKQYQGKHLLTGVALRIAIEALEKQVPKKPKVVYPLGEGFSSALACPCCGHGPLSDIDKFCWNCGQAIDWSDSNE